MGEVLSECEYLVVSGGGGAGVLGELKLVYTSQTIHMEVSGGHTVIKSPVAVDRAKN